MKMDASTFALQIHGSFNKHSVSPHHFNHLKTSLPSTVKPNFLQELKRLPMNINVSEAIKNTSAKLLDAFVDSAFQFVDTPSLPSQKNFAPVEEIGGPVEVCYTEGEIPDDFPEGVYLRNGQNPLFGGLKSTVSMFGRSNHTWVEGEGMLHAVCFEKNASGSWTISYNNRYVETRTYKLKKQRNKPSFIPAVQGDPMALIAGILLNKWRFDSVNEYLCNTSVFAHSGKLYAVAENYLPHEFDISTLQTYDPWNLNGAWNRPFTSHPKRAPESGELVIMGFDALKPHCMVGVVSADGKQLSHKVDLNFNKCYFSHEIGVTLKYNIIMVYPLTIDLRRLLIGRQYFDYDNNGQARIGVMPRYGDADSVKWFDVKPHCTFHLINCFEDSNEVVVTGCRSHQSIIPGPAGSEQDKFEWFLRGFDFTKYSGRAPNNSIQDGFLFAHVYEWRLDMVTGEVKERTLSGTEYSMDFPVINEKYTGLKHKYGYTQVIDSIASSNAGIAKYGGLAKLHMNDPLPNPSDSENNGGESDQLIKVAYHNFGENNFCSGTVFAPKDGGTDEDDGWLVSFVHNEDTDVTQVYIIDAKNLESDPVAKITLPGRVPYGFHGTFVPMPTTHP